MHARASNVCRNVCVAVCPVLSVCFNVIVGLFFRTNWSYSWSLLTLVSGPCVYFNVVCSHTHTRARKQKEREREREREIKSGAQVTAETDDE
jgi:hypothetical protein